MIAPVVLADERRVAHTAAELISTYAWGWAATGPAQSVGPAS
jgi:hypothetical protein